MSNPTGIHPQDEADVRWFAHHPKNNCFYRPLNPEVDARWIGREQWTLALVICVNHETARNDFLVVPTAFDDVVRSELRAGVPLVETLVFANREDA